MSGADSLWQVRFLAGPRQGDVLALVAGQDFTIGRDPSSAILLVDEGARRLHATVRWRNGQPVLVDGDRPHGTSVNGINRPEQGLADGDLVELAGNVVRIEQRAAASEATPSGIHRATVQAVQSDVEDLVEVLLAIQEVLAGDTERMVERCLEILFRALPATRLSVIEIAADGELSQSYSVTPQGATTAYLGLDFARRVIAAGTPVLMEDAAEVGRILPEQQACSILGAPVPGSVPGGPPVAVLLCDNRERPGSLRARHLRVVAFAARAISSAFHRLQLEELAAAQAELAAARLVQQRLVGAPDPELSGHFDWRVLYDPAASVGGDFYDWHHRDGRTTWIVADVSGHGVAAALVVSLLRAFVKTLYPRDLPPAEFLQRLNELLVGELPPAMFVTAVVLRVDDAGGVAVASAGHPPVLVLRKGSVVEELPAGRGLLGFPPEFGLLRQVVEYRTVLVPGERLLLCSDGLTEAGPPSDQFQRRLHTLFADTAELPLAEVRAAIGAAVAAHHHGPLADDLTLVLGERRERGKSSVPWPSVGN